jgi:hypothetical protein
LFGVLFESVINCRAHRGKNIMRCHGRTLALLRFSQAGAGPGPREAGFFGLALVLPVGLIAPPGRLARWYLLSLGPHKDAAHEYSSQPTVRFICRP